jgi:prepilin-type N-terminal cleavage/methylation domain-containing protein
MRKGLTLIEMLVVLLLMGLSAALVAPALLRPAQPAEPALAPLLRNTRNAAVRRGETIYLRIGASGAWRVQGSGVAAEGDLATGQLAGFRGPPLTLVFSPLGTCGPTAETAAAGRALSLNPLTCELESSGSR